MEPSEIYIVTKALSLIAPSLVGIAQLLAMLCVLAVSLWILGRRNTAQLLSDGSLFAGKSVALAFLFAWSVISLSGVSTFVYFNF